MQTIEKTIKSAVIIFIICGFIFGFAMFSIFQLDILFEANEDKMMFLKNRNFIFYSLILIIVMICILVVFVFKKSLKLKKILRERRNEIAEKDLKIKTFIKNSDETILILNSQFEIKEFNIAAKKLLEFKDAEITGVKVEKLFFPNQIDGQHPFIELLKNKKSEVITDNIFKKNGEEITVEMKVHFQDEEIILMIKDLSNEIRTEKIIKESEEKYRYLFNKYPAFIIIWDLATLKILEVNEAVLQKYGYSSEEWSKMTVIDYRPKEDHEKIKNFAKKMQESDDLVKSNVWQHISKYGEIMQMEIASHKINFNGRKAILSLARDVTEQLKIQAELKESKEQLSLFIEHSPASLAMLDKEMRYIATSRRWITDYGLYGQDIIGKTHYEIFPEIPERWKEDHRRAVRGSIEKNDEDYFIRADGRKEWIRWEIRPWHKSSGEIGGIIMFTEVITEQMKAKELFQYQFENSPDIILIVNKFNKIEAINKTIPGGRTVNELIGQDCIEILPKESQENVKTALNSCFQTGEDQEIIVPMRFGIWHKSRFVAMINNETVTHVMIFASDVTYEKKIQ